MFTVLNDSIDPFYNLAFEEYVFDRMTGGDALLVWRNAPCVVVGCHQNICGEVRPALLRQMGVPVLRRSSGGGTVYHDLGNINYTLMLSGDGADYDRCLRPVIAALNDLGAPAQRGHGSDIAIDGRKISGSAQRISHGRLLHHGTLLFDADLDALNRITTRHKDRGVSSKATASAISTVTNIRDHLSKPMTVESFAEALLDRMLPEGAPRLELDEAQRAEVERIRNEKYAAWAWTWGRNPAFELNRTGALGGKPVELSYRAKKGVISEGKVRSDALDCPRAERMLEGARLDPDELYHICEALAGGEAETLLDLLL